METELFNLLLNKYKDSGASPEQQLEALKTIDAVLNEIKTNKLDLYRTIKETVLDSELIAQWNKYISTINSIRYILGFGEGNKVKTVKAIHDVVFCPHIKAAEIETFNQALEYIKYSEQGTTEPFRKIFCSSKLFADKEKLEYAISSIRFPSRDGRENLTAEAACNPNLIESSIERYKLALDTMKNFNSTLDSVLRDLLTVICSPHLILSKTDKYERAIEAMKEAKHLSKEMSQVLINQYLIEDTTDKYVIAIRAMEVVDRTKREPMANTLCKPESARSSNGTFENAILEVFLPTNGDVDVSFSISNDAFVLIRQLKNSK